MPITTSQIPVTSADMEIIRQLKVVLVANIRARPGEQCGEAELAGKSLAELQAIASMAGSSSRLVVNAGGGRPVLSVQPLRRVPYSWDRQS